MLWNRKYINIETELPNQKVYQTNLYVQLEYVLYYSVYLQKQLDFIKYV